VASDKYVLHEYLIYDINSLSKCSYCRLEGPLSVYTASEHFILPGLVII